MAGQLGGHGAYARQVVEGARRYAQRLLDENSELRRTVAALRRAAEDERRRALEAVDAASLVVHEFRERLRQVEAEKARLDDELATMRAIEGESQRSAEQYAMLEQQVNNLANLYVAGYRLHETLDREAVIQVLEEILANMVGSEEMALFETSPDGGALSLSAWRGIDPEPYRTIPLGVGAIGQAALTGETHVVVPEAGGDAAAEERLSACIPLRLGQKTVGVIAIFRLLPQKPALEALDREIFDLLASQAAMALYATSLHERACRGELVRGT